MAHARPAERILPQAPSFPLAAVAAAIAAILVTGILAFGAIDPFGMRGPSVEGPNVDPVLREAEARWELHRKLQSGDVDPLTQAQREWVRQRLQLGAALD